MRLKYLELLIIFLFFITLSTLATSKLILAIYNPDIPLDSAKETMDILSDIFSDLKLENKQTIVPIYFRYEKDFDSYIRDKKPDLIWVNPDYYIKDNDLQYKDILQETADGKFKQSLLLLRNKLDMNTLSEGAKVSIPNFDDRAIKKILHNFPELSDNENTSLIKFIKIAAFLMYCPYFWIVFEIFYKIR